MAEDLNDYFLERGVRVRYLHSDVDTLRRVELLRELRLGEYDVLVGINLLREGLDLPEVSLVAILDADKQGFLRSATSLIQTIGRAARHVSGEVHMYADAVTDAMSHAIGETDRRRDKQLRYNREHGIDPTPLRKKIADITDIIMREDAETEQLLSRSTRRDVPAAQSDLEDLIEQLTAQMHQAAGELQFELAARLRDEVKDLKKELRAMLGR
jgi:excinuclease ABC subunit B